MSNHEMPPQALLDPGMAIVTTGNLRGPILSVLRAACAPVKISDLLGRYHPDLHPRARDTLRDLVDLGSVYLSATHATALRGNGEPYRSTERREVVECARPVQEDRYTVPMPTHTPVARKAPVVAKSATTPRPKKERGARSVSPSEAQRILWRKRRAEVWPQIEELRATGLSIKRIGELTGISDKTVTMAIKERVADGWIDPYASKFTPVPITDHDKAYARKMRNEGASIRSICRRLGRDHKTVLRALLEKTL